LTEQFALALIDINNGRYEAAKQRLDFIILNDPSFPGATQKLAEVLVLMSIPTATPTPTLTPTPDLRGAEALFTQAKQLIAAQDWANALVALDQLRKDDPTYHTAEVDGMYYFALRNQGHYLITQQGNLEGGIYYLSLAERFAPLDNTANGLREGARLYILAASFWEVDWEQAVFYFSQLAGGWPSLWDGTMTAAQRYYQALMRYGDQLFEQKRYCAAYDQYVAAQAYGELDEIAAKNANKAYQICYPPTETPVPTDVVVGDTPVVDNTPTP
jgi:tetratricopeptide (TPR) repeat protein